MTPGPTPLTVPAGDPYLTIMTPPGSGGSTSLNFQLSITQPEGYAKCQFVTIQAAYDPAGGSNQRFTVTLQCDPSQLVPVTGELKVPALIESSDPWGSGLYLEVLSGWKV